MTAVLIDLDWIFAGTDRGDDNRCIGLTWTVEAA
jgi:hypothetical protein